MLIMQAPPLLGRVFSGIMKISRPLIGFIIKVEYSERFIYYYQNWSLQECLAVFIWGVKNVQGGGGGVRVYSKS